MTDEVNTSAYHTSFQLPAGQGSNNYRAQRHGPTDRRCAGGKYTPGWRNGSGKGSADAAQNSDTGQPTYDAAGNRLLKVAYATDGTTPTERTWYLRDGSGGVMSYAIEDVALQTTTEEFAHCRCWQLPAPKLEDALGEVSDHLGNTRVSFTTDGNGDVLVIEAHDYYPHGGLLPGRQLSGTGGGPRLPRLWEYDPEVGLTALTYANTMGDRSMAHHTRPLRPAP
ncbi:MAG: hypothetical protein IPI72_17790 [Flavobacteriales bacterium]|nr:hypothetical protein [Flavobacteriales bacterium]